MLLESFDIGAGCQRQINDRYNASNPASKPVRTTANIVTWKHWDFMQGFWSKNLFLKYPLMGEKKKSASCRNPSIVEPAKRSLKQGGRATLRTA